MKSIKSKMIYILIINILLNVFNYVKGDDDCSDCPNVPSCNDNCRKSLITIDSPYYLCNFDEIKKYYSITNNGCEVKEKCNNNENIVDGTLECVESCDSSYKMGNYCYTSEISNAHPKETGSNEYICANKYYTSTDSNGKVKYICLAENAECPDDYNSYNYDTGLCFQGSCSLLSNNFRTKVEHRTSATNINRCSSSCINSEYLKVDSTESSTEYICVDNCSPLLKITESGINKCISLTDCENKGFYKNGDECIQTCNVSPYTNTYYNYGQKECVSSCQEPFKYKD